MRLFRCVLHTHKLDVTPHFVNKLQIPLSYMETIVLLEVHVINKFPVSTTGTGYTLAWDNVQKLVEARHQSTTSTNKMMMWALAFAASSRVNTLDLDDDQEALRAEELPLETFLPRQEDMTEERNRMEVLVERIICSHLDYFKGLAECVTPQIAHEHTLESNMKSELVNETVSLNILRECM